MTITIELDEPMLNAFQQEASDLGISVDRLADAIIRQHFRSGTHVSGSATDPAFQKAAAETFRENEELYRRLAK